MLPGEEEAREVGRADRLDLRAQAIQCVAMDPSQQSPIAPLELRRTGERSAQHGPLGFKSDHRGIGFGLGNRQGLRELARGSRTGEGHTAAQQLCDRFLASPGTHARRRRHEVDAAWMDGEHFGKALGGDTQCFYMTGSAAGDERIEQIGGDLVGKEESGREQGVVQLVGVARIGTRFVAHALDRSSVEHVVARHAAGVDGLRPSLFEGCVIEKCVRLGVEDVVRQGRRLRSIARDADDLSAVNALQHASQPVEVHRLLQTVVHRLIDQGMVGDLTVAGDVLETRGCIRKNRGHQIVGHGALKLRRNLAPSAIPRDGQGDRGVPAPARLKHRRVEKRLDQHVSCGRRMEITEDIGQGEGMLRPERKQHRIVGGRCLQLEVELTAEAFAQRQPPRLVDPASERRVDDELHAARLIEEALGHERQLRGDDAKSDARRVEVLEDLARRGFRDSALLDEALDRIGFRSKIADRARKLIASGRRFSEPEWNVRRRSLRISDAHHAAAHLHYLP